MDRILSLVSFENCSLDDVKRKQLSCDKCELKESTESSDKKNAPLPEDIQNVTDKWLFDTVGFKGF